MLTPFAAAMNLGVWAGLLLFLTRRAAKAERAALQARVKQLEQAEQQLAGVVETFERDKAAWENRLGQLKDELEKRRRAQEADLRAREEECQRLMEQVTPWSAISRWNCSLVYWLPRSE